MASHERVVVVGGGLAAASAVQSARESGFEGEVVVIAEEPRVPYERPPLSKGYLIGTDAASSLSPHDLRWYRRHDVDVRRGSRTVALDPAGHTLEVESPEAGRATLEFDRLLLATGARARRFSGPGAGLRGVHALRTLADSTRLRTALRVGGRRVVVVGGGWIGLEAAAAARGYGNDVTVLVRGGEPLEAAIGIGLGAMFRGLHEQHGVEVRRGVSVTALRGHRGRVAAAVLGTGEEVPADVVLFGIGAVPNVELATSAGLRVDDGITTDASLRTSAEDVFAAGDVASVWNPRLERHLRVEHWANAGASGAAAGRALAGAPAAFDEVPYFFTDQYDLGMEYSGYGGPAADAELVVRGDVPLTAESAPDAKREGIVFWLAADGRVVAGMNVNVWDVNPVIQRLIRSGRVVSREELADPAVPLDALAGDTA
ncbi:3-phenylpropionate/trans-cinnamate dioxygenase ferredoxin reductase subunit [Agromyces sp. CF514]|uniref:NAD(P)/FAD-dependent oxidoreductase n=1 Tax=Agromyces sp. CF514 TaxID=1881031 RepID=UPI0008F2C4AF|nr:FAD/NAD(P)-binding oxidoreductase [Agromyces sp. CF514]SFR73016.1 3-phenylpropionate/trans-cinnamate dioxygenase ferredoxin reductase subunit [Agromyces sp. CF514]